MGPMLMDNDHLNAEHLEWVRTSLQPVRHRGADYSVTHLGAVTRIFSPDNMVAVTDVRVAKTVRARAAVLRAERLRAAQAAVQRHPDPFARFDGGSA